MIKSNNSAAAAGAIYLSLCASYVMSITLSQNLRWKYGWIASLSLAARSGENLDFRFADFEIDVARHELRRRGELVPIEPQVFDLLVHLIRNRNRIVSKNELIDTIWMGRVVSEETLSSRVSAARRAIDDNGVDQALIRTHYKRCLLYTSPSPRD